MKGTSLCYTVMLELQLDGLPADSICQVALFCKALVSFLTMKSLMAPLLGCVNET